MAEFDRNHKKYGYYMAGLCLTAGAIYFCPALLPVIKYKAVVAAKGVVAGVTTAGHLAACKVGQVIKVTFALVAGGAVIKLAVILTEVSPGRLLHATQIPTSHFLPRGTLLTVL